MAGSGLKQDADVADSRYSGYTMRHSLVLPAGEKPVIIETSVGY